MLGQKRDAQDRRAGRFDDMYQMFPRLKERQHTEAGVLSGGEQQMLTLCRTLMGDPDLIMIDEPTEGLAPKIVELVAEYLRELQMIVNLWGFAYITMVPVIGERVLGLSAALIGVLMSIEGLGALIGALLIGRSDPHVDTRRSTSAPSLPSSRRAGVRAVQPGFRCRSR